MGLDQKASDWQDKVLKAIIFFAVVGCIVLLIAVNMIGKTMSDITTPFAPAPATNTATGAGSTTQH